MRFSDSHGHMSPAEQHGILLRMATDRLETGVDFLAIITDEAVVEGEVLLNHIHEIASAPRLLPGRELRP